MAKFSFMHCIKKTFDKILSVLKKELGDTFLNGTGRHRPGPVSKFTDIEVITLSLASECLSIDSENLLFEKISSDYKNDFPNLISRRQYNDRRKELYLIINHIQNKLASELNAINEVYAIDSMPLPICKLARMGRNKKWYEEEHSVPDKGYCASQDFYFYGYKLHALCSPSGVIQTFDLTRASIHDVKYLNDISDMVSNCIITGDRGYINKDLHKKLWDTSKICMEVPSRSNQKESKKVLYVLRKIRKRIETVFSQLCDQFMIRRNYAKSFAGFRVRILSKVTAMTILQKINKVKGMPIGQIKYALR